ncbi:hypothetical protein ACIQUS_09585 [Pseudomonas sp. NPDC090755]|uniref:hypothetical protein n=1 Tax=Pseudomonas sp. NPDC090755 TaxID=3364481 RepID=UPI00383BE13F
MTMLQASRAVPTATHVVMLGEPRVGHSIVGSYRYSNAHDEPEEGSTFRWYIDAQAGPETLELLLGQEHLGKLLQFAVTPRAASGDTGEEARSLVLEVFDDGQGISARVMADCFLAQSGQFSVYEDEPPQRVMVTSQAAVMLFDEPTQKVYTKGRADAGGLIPSEIRQLLDNNPPLRMFSTSQDFAVLISNQGSNQLLAWGVNMTPGEGSLRNIKSVYSNAKAMAFIYNNPPAKDYKIGAIGNVANGGQVPLEVQFQLMADLPRAIYSTASAFAVLTQDNYVRTWGAEGEGGGMPADTRKKLDGIRVTEIYATASAFCAIGPLRVGGSEELHLVSWGSATGGGVLSAEKTLGIMTAGGVRHVIAARDAFCVITMANRVEVWGNASYGGVLSEPAKALNAHGNIVMCKASAWAFCMVNSSGQAEAWGSVGHGGDTPLFDAGQALEDSGCKPHLEALFRQMAQAPGGTVRELPGSTSSRLISEEGEISLHSNDSSFFLWARDALGLTGAVHAWGGEFSGGKLSDSVKQVLLASVIEKVYCTNRSYAVLVEQGNFRGALVSWGATSAQGGAGEVPEPLRPYLLREVQELYAIKQMPPASPSSSSLYSALIARRTEPGYVLWGALSDITDEVFVPEQRMPSSSVKACCCACRCAGMIGSHQG